jgi:hypothetical protein
MHLSPGKGQEVGEEIVVQEERQEAEIEQFGVRGTVVVLFKFNPRILQMDYVRPARR